MIESFVLFYPVFFNNFFVVSYAVSYAVTYAMSYAIFYHIMNLKYLLCRANRQVSLRVAVTEGKEELMILTII